MINQPHKNTQLYVGVSDRPATIKITKKRPGKLYTLLFEKLAFQITPVCYKIRNLVHKMTLTQTRAKGV